MSYDCLLLNNFVWNVFQPLVNKWCLEESPTKIGVRHANRSFGCGCFPILAEKHIPQLKKIIFTQKTSDYYKHHLTTNCPNWCKTCKKEVSECGGRDGWHSKVEKTNKYHSPGQHLRGMARGGYLPVFVDHFLPVCTGWEFTDFTRHSNLVGIYLQPSRPSEHHLGTHNQNIGY